MKTTYKSAISILASIFAMAAARAQTTPQLNDDRPQMVPVLYHTAYTPGGFDSNDNVQFVAEGVFANSCYRHAQTQINIDENNKIIRVKPAAFLYNGFCLQVILPFDRVIEVGLLSPGRYQIIQTNGTNLGELNIRPSTTRDADDFLYAPVSQAFFRSQGFQSQVHITGEFSNSCLQLDQVKVAVEPKVIVVQPIAKVLNRSDCQDGHFPFQKTVDFQTIRKGRYLLHVRSMNGKAINNLVDVGI